MKSIRPIRSNNRVNRFSYGDPLINTHIENGKTIYANKCENLCSNAICGRKVNIAIDEDYQLIQEIQIFGKIFIKQELYVNVQLVS
jgi:hypothetical protein